MTGKFNSPTDSMQKKVFAFQAIYFPSLFALSLGLSSFAFASPANAQLSRDRWLLKRPQSGVTTDLHSAGHGLLSHLSLVNGDAPLITRRPQRAGVPRGLHSSAVFAQTPVAPIQQAQKGSQVIINGRTIPAGWQQWREGNTLRTGLSDTAAVQLLGVELLNTNNPEVQPVNWFSSTPFNLRTRLNRPYRYLDITDLARNAGIQLQVTGETLTLGAPAARLQNIRQGNQPWGTRFVVDLDRSAFWQISQAGTEAVVMIDGVAPPELVQRFSPSSDRENNAQPLPFTLEASGTQTKVKFNLPAGQGLRISSLPNRLVIDLRGDAIAEQDILWAPGLRWRRQTVALSIGQGSTQTTKNFPVVWLEADLRRANLSLKPIWTDASRMDGTTPLISMARASEASAAINGGFFNRNNQLPLGAIRQNGRWLSSPILDRGAIAWNDRGEMKIGRLSLQETLTTGNGTTLPVLFHNSGYVQRGIARYSPEWGSSYTPLTDNETIVVVQNNIVTQQTPGGSANATPISIPANGYLLTIRSNATPVETLPVGTSIRLETVSIPGEFDRYPNILGAGPLLVQNRQIVLDALGEKFSEAFAQQAASRSAIGVTPQGTVIIAAIHNRPGERGATLNETAQIMQLLGTTDALNLDGGSSTGLYLGGHLLDRSPVSAARVHNGLGIFMD